jgi:hypothetical protein
MRETKDMTDDDIAAALNDCGTEHQRVAEISTRFMLGILLLPALGVCALTLPVAPAVAAGGLVAGLIGALGCWVASEVWNMRALAIEKDIEALGDESAIRDARTRAAPEYTKALSATLSPSFDAARRGMKEDIPVSPAAPLTAPKLGNGG